MDNTTMKTKTYDILSSQPIKEGYRAGLRLLLIALVASPRLWGQAPTFTPAAEGDLFKHRDSAKAAAARTPLGAAHLRRAMSLRGELGLGSDDSFGVINANTDDLGATHVRLQQYFKSVKVENGQIISHVNARGEYGQYTNSLKTRININTQPNLSNDDALQALARVTGPAGPGTVTPKVELVILPVMERYMIATGAPVADPVTRIVPGDKRLPTGEDGFEAPPDPTNADQTARRVKEYRLAYAVRTGEVSATRGVSPKGIIYHVDANTGGILRQRAMESQATSIGQGKGKFSGSVTFNTTTIGPWYLMNDTQRNFHTRDTDHSDSDPQNLDSDGQWGDGLDFQGDANASVANRQTALVDGMFGATVYWDLMNNVFKRKGPNNKFYDVNVYAHEKTDYDDAFYSGWTGNIYLGDGKTRQALDCLGHESGHGLNDFTANLGGSGESGGLNESNSDIWGAMTTFYLKGGAYASHSDTIPGVGGSWKSVCTARNMQKPSASQHQSDYWYPTIGNGNEHDVAAPNNRVFYFLSQGASSFMKNPDYSPLIPWGMTGIGNPKAAQIWYDVITNYLTDDADYSDARFAAFLASLFRFGPASPEFKAVQNAYAAINVGQTAGGYPAGPPVMLEKEPNNQSFQATPILQPNNSRPAGTPNKIQVLGGGIDDDWYSVTLKAGNSITVRLEPGALTDYDLQIFDGGFKLLATSIKAMGYVDQATITATANQTYFIKVNQFMSQSPLNLYQMSVDFF
jgi:Zn-dependent metalloprotease